MFLHRTLSQTIEHVCFLQGEKDGHCGEGVNAGALSLNLEQGWV